MNISSGDRGGGGGGRKGEGGGREGLKENL
jgi:hypothetical protein